MKMFRVRFGNSSFTLPECWFEDIDAWIHEFTEDCLIDTLEDVFDLMPYHRYSKILIDGVVAYTTIRHIMVSLHMKSVIDGVVVTPDEFYGFIRGLSRKVKK